MKLTGTAILALAALAGVGFVLVRYGPAFLKAINPTNPNNVFSTGANKVVQSVTGDANQTVGGAVFDTANPRAGLAPNETVIAPGIIKVTVPSSAPESTVEPVTPDADVTSEDVIPLGLGA